MVGFRLSTSHKVISSGLSNGSVQIKRRCWIFFIKKLNKPQLEPYPREKSRAIVGVTEIELSQKNEYPLFSQLTILFDKITNYDAFC